MKNIKLVLLTIIVPLIIIGCGRNQFLGAVTPIQDKSIAGLKMFKFGENINDRLNINITAGAPENVGTMLYNFDEKKLIDNFAFLSDELCIKPFECSKKNEFTKMPGISKNAQFKACVFKKNDFLKLNQKDFISIEFVKVDNSVETITLDKNSSFYIKLKNLMTIVEPIETIKKEDLIQ